MAQVKGLVVQIGGDTSGLDKAIKSASKGASALQKELNEINRALKLDPSSTTLLAQKQQVLSEKIKDTTNLLKALKEEQARYIKEGGDLNTAEYRKLERQIAQTTQELKELNYENSKWKEASDNLQKFSDTMTKVGSKITEIGKSLTQNLTVPITGLLTAGAKLNMDLEKSTIAFEVFTGSTEKAQETIDNLRKDAQKSVFSTNDLIQANQYLLGTGMSAEEAREQVNYLASAIALSGKGSSEFLNMAYNLAQVKSNAKATSVDLRQFGNNITSFWQILTSYTGKTREELTETGVTYEIIAEAMRDSAQNGGILAGAMDKFANTTSGKITQMVGKLQEALMGLTESLMPTIEKIVNKIIDLVDKFNALSPETKETILNVMLALASLGPLLTIIGKIITSVGTIAGGLSKLTALIGKVSASASASGTTLSALAGPIGIVIGVIAGLTAEFVHLFKTNEEFNAKVTDVWNNTVTFFQETIMPVIERIKDTVMNVINTIWGTLQSVWSVVEPFIQEIFENLLDWWNDTGLDIMEGLTFLLERFLDGFDFLWNNVIDPLIKILTEVLKPVVTTVMAVISTAITGVLDTISNVWNIIKSIFTGIIDFLVHVFQGDWEGAWDSIVNTFKTIFESIKNIAKTPINQVIDIINGLLRGINSIKLPDWVPRNWR